LRRAINKLHGLCAAPSTSCRATARTVSSKVGSLCDSETAINQRDSPLSAFTPPPVAMRWQCGGKAPHQQCARKCPAAVISQANKTIGYVGDAT
jgi:hypothetical protein